MEKAWKSKVGGILSIIEGVPSILWGIFIGSEWLGSWPPLTAIALGVIAIVGGIYALKRKSWGLALAGSICSVIGCEIFRLVPLFISWVHSSHAYLFEPPILGILAIIFVVLGKGEFKAKALAGDISPKSRRVTTLLAFFLGVFGAHRFYIGKTRTAIAMLLLSIVGWAAIWLSVGPVWLFEGPLFFAAQCFVTAVGTWVFVDFVLAVAGDMTDKEGRLIRKW
jgi:TM2 domain-containing membrane protein YozV